MSSKWSTHPDYQISLAQKLLSKLSVQVRGQQYAIFKQKLKPTASSSVLDVGIRPDEDLCDSNFFEQVYPYQNKLTCASIEDCSELIKHKYPKAKFTLIRAGQNLPFKNKQFDIVVSWATLEHTGGYKQQRLFISELLRVGKKVFITTPDRLCPYEPHSCLFLMHWLPLGLFRKVCQLLGKSFWAQEKYLNPLFRQDLERLLPNNSSAEILAFQTFQIIPSHLLLIKGKPI